MPIYRLLLVTAPVAGLLIAALSLFAVERDRQHLDRSALAKIAAKPWADPVVTGSVTRRKAEPAHTTRQAPSPR